MLDYHKQESEAPSFHQLKNHSGFWTVPMLKKQVKKQDVYENTDEAILEMLCSF